MNKHTFFKTLKKHLKKLKYSAVQKNISYYDELLSDMVENGATEAEALEKIGSPKKIAQEILQNAAPEDLKKKDIMGTVLIAVSAFFIAAIILVELCFHTYSLSAITTFTGNVSIIGGADGPTSVFVAGKLGRPLGLFAAAAAAITVTVIYKLIRHFKY